MDNKSTFKVEPANCLLLENLRPVSTPAGVVLRSVGTPEEIAAAAGPEAPAEHSVPAVRFKVLDAGTRDVPVGDRALSSAYVGLTSLSATDRKRLVADFAEAYLSACSAAGADGLFAAPVVAFVRYYGNAGECLYDTPPVLLRPAQLFAPSVDVTVRESGSLAAGYTVAVPVFNIEAEFDAGAHPEIGAAEVLLSPCIHPYSADGTAAVGTVRAAGSALRVSLPGYGRGLGPGSGLDGRVRRILGAAESLCRVNTRIAAPFAAVASVFAIYHHGTESPAEEAEALAAALAKAPKAPRLLDVLIAPPHSFTAVCRAEAASTVAWGDVTVRRFKGWNPAVFAADSSEKSWRAICTVRFGGTSKGVTFSAEYSSGAPSKFGPVLSYPSPDATSMTLTVQSGGRTRSRNFALAPDASGRRACFVAEDLKPFEIPESSASIIIDTASADLRLPEYIALAPAASPARPDAYVRLPARVEAVCPMPQPDSAWEFGRCRFVAAGAAGLVSVGVGAGRRSIALRTLDTRAADSPDCLAAGTDGVYAALAGAVVFVATERRKVREIMTGAFTSLAWNGAARELTATGADGCATWCADFDRVFLRPELAGAKARMQGADPVLVVGDKVLSLASEADDRSASVRGVWEFEPAAGAPFLPRRLGVRARGRLVDGSVSLCAIGGTGRSEPIVGATFSGDLRSPLVMPLYSRPHRRLRLELAGDAEDFELCALVL